MIFTLDVWKVTTDAIFIVRQIQEKFRAKGKKLYFGFVDLNKAFDMFLREVIRWAMRKLGVKEWLVSAVKSMYTGAKTVVRTVYGNCNCFEVYAFSAWRCWLGSRKGVQPVENCVVGCWHGYLSRTMCRFAYGPADATATHYLLLQ